MFNLRRMRFSSCLLRSAKKGSKKGGKEEEIGDAIEQIGERYLVRFPADVQQVQQPKKMVTMLSVGHLFIIKNDRVCL